jgi:uncharacterized protein YprB with RNaseH-like and TPR domain
MTKPRVCFFDIETAPSLGYFWGKLWETDIIEVQQPWYMLCFAYQWDGEAKIHARALPDYKNFKKDKQDDSALIKDLWKIFDEADVLIAHNGDRFDIRKTYARFAMLGMPPPSPSKTIDTYKHAKRWFDFESNRLNTLGRLLGVGTKLANTGFALWKKVMLTADMKAWGLMVRYNKQDVRLLKRVYLKLRPFMRTHPNLAIYEEFDRPACPKCTSTNVEKRGFQWAAKLKYQRYLCNSCHGWFQGECIRKKKK